MKELVLILIRGLINGITYYIIGFILMPNKLNIVDASMLGIANILIWNGILKLSEKFEL